jgi:hypothetical protein
MNSKAYLQKISSEFGGIQKDALKIKLIRLVALAKREEHQTPSDIPPPLPTVADQPFVAITPHDFIPKNSYDAAMKLIRDHNNTGWFHITEVPENIFPDFMLIADLRREIEFDSERECQYVRVINFGRK